MITLYGIPNCDTIKKARRWLDEHAIVYHFHNYKKQGVDETQLNLWCAQVSWEVLLNKRGTTWRQLPETEKREINETTVIQLLIKNPSMIKRPVLVTEKHVEVGFDQDRYQQLLL